MLSSLRRRFDVWKWKLVHENLHTERLRLLTERKFAEYAAAHPLHGCIGEGLPAAADGGCRVLELGCGDGKFVAMLACLGYEVIGVDPIQYPGWKDFDGVDRVQLMSGIKAETLPFEDGSFDAVACMGALLYFEDPEAAIGEMRRVLRRGGHLVLRTVNRGNLYTRCTGRRLDPASRNLYSDEGVVALLARHGFGVQRVFSFGFWPPILTNLWWFAANTMVTPGLHRVMSMLTPRGMRVNWVVFAVRNRN